MVVWIFLPLKADGEMWGSVVCEEVLAVLVPWAPGDVYFTPAPTSKPTSTSTPTATPMGSPSPSPTSTAPYSWKIVAASNYGFGAWLDCDLYATADFELPPSYGAEVQIIGQPVASNAKVIQYAPSGSYSSGKWRYTFEKNYRTFEDNYERWIIKEILVYTSADFVCRTSGTGDE